MHSLEKIERGFRWAAVPVALISAYFTFEFARSTMASPGMGFLLGLALAVCALASGYIWTIRQAAQQAGVGKAASVFLLAAGVLFTGTDAFTNAGSLLWQRSAADNQAQVTNVKYEDSRKAIEDAEARIKFFETRIADLKSANPWITTVSADGLKGQIPAMEEAIRQESKRGGCGPKCLALQKDLAGIQERIGLAEQLGSHEKMLAAAHTGLEKARAAAGEKTSVVSATSSQALSLASLGTFSLNPSEDAQAWTSYVVGLVLAVFLTFGPMALNWVGFGGWRVSQEARVSRPASPGPYVPHSASVPAVAPAERPERIVERHTTLQPVNIGASLYELGQYQLGRVRTAGA